MTDFYGKWQFRRHRRPVRRSLLRPVHLSRSGFGAVTVWLVCTGATLAQPFPPRPSESPLNTQNYAFSGLVGSNFQFESRASDSLGNVRTFSIPVTLPLEVSVGRFYMGGQFEYAVSQYRQAGVKQSVEGARYASPIAGFHFFRRGRFRLQARETVNIPIAEDEGRFEAPRNAWLNSGGYRFDSDVEARYLFRRSHMRFGVGHQWRQERDDYDPGETALAHLSYGYGIGGASRGGPEPYPVTVLAGVGARYNYADTDLGEEVVGTEYGTVFFAPGLQISSQSLSVQAIVEVPVYNIKPEDDSYEEEVRANFGLRYYFGD